MCVDIERHKFCLTIRVMDNMSKNDKLQGNLSNSDANDEAFFMIRNGFLSLSLLSLCDTHFDFCSFTASANYTMAQALNKVRLVSCDKDRWDNNDNDFMEIYAEKCSKLIYQIIVNN